MCSNLSIPVSLPFSLPSLALAPLLPFRPRPRQAPPLLHHATSAPSPWAAGSPAPPSSAPTCGSLRTTIVSALTAGKVDPLRRLGAFTPTCSEKHLPGFVEKRRGAEGQGHGQHRLHLRERCLRDAGVEGEPRRRRQRHAAVGRGQGTPEGDWVRAQPGDQPVGLGVRSRWYALLVEDGVVKVLNLEEGPPWLCSVALAWPWIEL
ncbi:hypothetical protein NL676_004675 [Syzygium grande]|nr:hypothetical protein NL676_004675 [Syzygium grande]